MKDQDPIDWTAVIEFVLWWFILALLIILLLASCGDMLSVQ